MMINYNNIIRVMFSDDDYDDDDNNGDDDDEVKQNGESF